MISGFRITSIIKGDLESGSFSLRAFRTRRVRRIVPALLAVTACSPSAAHAFGFLPEQQAVGVQAVSALSSTANLFF